MKPICSISKSNGRPWGLICGTITHDGTSSCTIQTSYAPNMLSEVAKLPFT